MIIVVVYQLLGLRFDILASVLFLCLYFQKVLFTHCLNRSTLTPIMMVHTVVHLIRSVGSQIHLECHVVEVGVGERGHLRLLGVGHDVCLFVY